MTQTPNFQLNQWSPEDYVRRTDFNADNLKIDTALGMIPRVVVGTYTGDGAESREIDLGFKPKAVFVCQGDGAIHESGTIYGGLALQGFPIVESYGQQTCTGLALTETGFQVAHKNISYRNALTNNGGTTYHYFAIG